MGHLAFAEVIEQSKVGTDVLYPVSNTTSLVGVRSGGLSRVRLMSEKVGVRSEILRAANSEMVERTVELATRLAD